MTSIAMNDISTHSTEIMDLEAGESKKLENTYTFNLSGSERKLVEPLAYDLGDDQVLLMSKGDNRTAVIVDTKTGEAFPVWGDPHVSLNDSEGNFTKGFEFVNNMTLDLGNGKSLTLETGQPNGNGLTYITAVSIYDANGADNQSEEATFERFTYDGSVVTQESALTGDAAQDKEDSISDGGLVEFVYENGELKLTRPEFEDEKGNKLNSADILKNTNDATADVFKKDGVHNETIVVTVEPLYNERGEIDWDAMSLAVIIMAVLMNRQDSLEDNIKIKLKAMDGDNNKIDELNSVLTTVLSKMPEKTTDDVKLDGTTAKLLVDSGIVDVSDEGVSYVDGVLTMPGGALETAIKGKIDSLSSQSQQDLTEFQNTQKQYTQTGEMNSNLLNSLFQVASAIIGNLR